jgi:hypothetical protein
VIWLVAVFVWLVVMAVLGIGFGRLLARVGAMYDDPDPSRPPDREPEDAHRPETALEEAA